MRVLVCECVYRCMCVRVYVWVYVCIVVYVCLCVNVCVGVCGDELVRSSLELLREHSNIMSLLFGPALTPPPSPISLNYHFWVKPTPTPSVITLYHYSSFVFQHASMCFFFAFFDINL